MFSRFVRSGRSVAAVLALSLAVVPLAACGSESADGSTNGTITSGPSGDPVAGGQLKALQISEPRNLDPLVLLNASQGNGMLGNALYGTLMTSNEVTGEIEYSLATDFSSTDQGQTFTLTLREGVTFSDGTPLTAEAVKFNWDRLKDVSLAANSLPDATTVKEATVVDARTLTVVLAQPQPFFATQVIESSMNWIGEPTALTAGASAFDANPIGAGPFMLDSWARGGTIALVKNPAYWDAPRPYLDSIQLNTAANPQQRTNAVTTSDADLSIENDWQQVQKAQLAALQSVTEPQAGGQFLSLNTRVAPFDNVKARQAISAAIDTDALNLALFGRANEDATTLFPQESPLFSDTVLHRYDAAKAQTLLDELAAAGTPVDFTFTVFSGSEKIGEAVQTQLSVFKNVTVDIKVADWSETGRIFGESDFEMAVQATNFVEPDPVLYNAFITGSRRNGPGISDPALDAALKEGRVAASPAERTSAYATVAERLAELAPAIYYSRAAQAVTATPLVGGIDLYGRGSLLPDRLWLQQ